MAERNRPHIFVRDRAKRSAYTPHGRKITPRRPPSPPDRALHAQNLANALLSAQQEALQRSQGVSITVAGAVPAIYVQFESHPDFDLELDALENATKGIEVVAVQEDARRRRATVFVPDGAIGHFLKKFEQYATQLTEKGEPRHRRLVESIADLRLATLRALWTDAPEAYPVAGQSIWWEIWLRRHDGRELHRLEDFAKKSGMPLGTRRLGFDDRIVTLMQGTPEQLSRSLDVLADMAEVRLAKESGAPFMEMDNAEQGEWSTDLRDRSTPSGSNAPAVCVMDTGVNRGHPLLEHSLFPDDAHAVDPNWGRHDHDGHGTEMAGLALYGDLAPVLLGTDRIHLGHRLESVKVLPPPSNPPNPPELYGAVMAAGVSAVEVTAPSRRRTFSMAISAKDERDQGKPTSWSAALDALAAGRSFDETSDGLIYLDNAEKNLRRLFVVAAGNVENLAFDHITQSDTEAIHDPGQAWNAITVGASTNLCAIDPADKIWAGWSPVAPPGELSPWSTTGVMFHRVWPIKPDIVVEGGNVASSPNKRETSYPVHTMSLLTTSFEPARNLFTPTWATSPATAQAARMAAMIQAEFPNMWPETVRALLVHSAEWTWRMRGQIEAVKGKKAKIDALVRRYGFGVPNLIRALRSASNALTLVVQDEIAPFSDGKMNEMHIHPLPWPKDVLAQMFDTTVRLRVTLSYFIEPNPGSRGWKTRHRYASHGLRFEVKLPNETEEAFRKRLNKKALEEGDEKPDGSSDSSAWLLGTTARHKGSLHADIWEGSAAELAERGCIGIYPVTGWWKELPKRDRSRFGARYALVVSIETDRAEVDIWTPVANLVGVPVAVTI
jgi:hypothetical protein